MEIIREIIITGSIILAILIVSLWSLKQWNMYKMMKDPNVLIGCNPSWCGTWMCPDACHCRGCDESGDC